MCVLIVCYDMFMSSKPSVNFFFYNPINKNTKHIGVYNINTINNYFVTQLFGLLVNGPNALFSLCPQILFSIRKCIGLWPLLLQNHWKLCHLIDFNNKTYIWSAQFTKNRIIYFSIKHCFYFFILIVLTYFVLSDLTQC